MSSSKRSIHQAKRAGSKAANQAGRAVKKSVEAGQQFVEEARHETEEILHDAAERLQGMTDEVHNRYGEVVAAAKERAGIARANAADLAGQVGDYVKDNPGRCLLAAFGGGVVVGLLLDRYRLERKSTRES